MGSAARWRLFLARVVTRSKRRLSPLGLPQSRINLLLVRLLGPASSGAAACFGKQLAPLPGVQATDHCASPTTHPLIASGRFLSRVALSLLVVNCTIAHVTSPCATWQGETSSPITTRMQAPHMSDSMNDDANADS